MTDRQKIWLLLGICAAAISVVFVFVPPFPQPLEYHGFADSRSAWGIPNFGDVLSNIPLLLAGLYGLWVLVKRDEAGPWSGDARLPLAVFFIGVLLVVPGSAYYHWSPNNWTLFWDRLPMTVAFMGLLAAVVTDRINAKAGVRYVLPALVIIGMASVIFWISSELGCDFAKSFNAAYFPTIEVHCTGDLRAYALAHFLPVLIIPLILWLWPRGQYITWRAIIWAFVFYALAKFAEHYDHQIYKLLGSVVSGHTLKHLFAAMAPVALVMNLRR